MVTAWPLAYSANSISVRSSLVVIIFKFETGEGLCSVPPRGFAPPRSHYLLQNKTQLKLTKKVSYQLNAFHSSQYLKSSLPNCYTALFMQCGNAGHLRKASRGLSAIAAFLVETVLQ